MRKGWEEDFKARRKRMSWNMNMKEIKERDKERMKVVSLVYLRVCLLPVEMETNFLK